MKKEDLRPVIVGKEGKRGYFHLWEQWFNVVGASAFPGGHSAGQVGSVYGIVEFEDGCVERVEPTEIIFVD